MANKKNYNKMSTEKAKIETTNEIVSEAVVESVEPVVVKPISGIVVDCKKLNVRKAPNINSDVVRVIAKGTEVGIDPAGGNEDFYKVSVTATCTGYCMKKYISVE